MAHAPQFANEDLSAAPLLGVPPGVTPTAPFRKTEQRQWRLWTVAFAITILLTAGILSFVVVLGNSDLRLSEISVAVRGLIGLVLLFDIYAAYQQIQISRIRRQLFEREEMFRLITENAEEMIAMIDASGRRLYNSPAYQRVLGYTAQELQSTGPLEQVHPDDRLHVQQAADEALRGGAGRRIEYRMRHKDGSWRLLESTASTILSESGKVEKLVVVNRDVTAHRRLEEQLRQAQKMDAIGRLSGGIAHDFNNLLGVIIGYGEFLDENIPKDSPLASSVSEILQSGRRAASLTKQLLAFSRQQVMEPKVLDLNVVVGDMEKLLHRLIGEHIELKSNFAGEASTVMADQSQIEQVLLNLAVNARDAMPKGGKLVVETQHAVIDETMTRQYPYPVLTGRYVLLAVSDSGIGMDTATRIRIFEPFFTTKDKGKGTGLGLSVVYGIVKQSGGYIHVYSEPGLGTTFKIYLPYVDRAAEGGTSDKAKRATGGTETVLLVEDEDSLRVLTRNILQSFGYRVIEADNGVNALIVSRKHEEEIHLLLTDIVMPEMGGKELAETLARERAGIVTMFMSGYTGQTYGGAVLSENSNFIQKPFARDAIARKVRLALDARRTNTKETASQESVHA